MKITHHRITLINVRKPERRTLNDELQWIGASLGLFNPRDKEQSCFRIFIQLLKSGSHGRGLSSDELAYALQLSRGTVVHHLNKLMESGIVMHHGGMYILRDTNLNDLITEIQRDINRTCESLKVIAQEVDKSLGREKTADTPE